MHTQHIVTQVYLLKGPHPGHMHMLFPVCGQVFDDGDRAYLVTELLNGGELLDRILKQCYLPEADAKVRCMIIV